MEIVAPVHFAENMARYGIQEITRRRGGGMSSSHGILPNPPAQVTTK